MALTKTSRLELLVSFEHGGTRLCTAGWLPDSLRRRLDPRGDAYPVAFDTDALERWMWEGDAPYSRRQIESGWEIEATGRSAERLAGYVDTLVG